MNKFQIVLTEVKTLVVELDAKTSDIAVREVKKVAITAQSFKKRIGAVLVADVRKIDDDNS